MQQVDRVFGRYPHVFGDAAVGIVVLAGNVRDQIVPAVAHPLADQLVGQPTAPTELQAAFHHQVRGGNGDVRQKNQYDQPIWVKKRDIERCSSASNRSALHSVIITETAI